MMHNEHIGEERETKPKMEEDIPVDPSTSVSAVKGEEVGAETVGVTSLFAPDSPKPIISPKSPPRSPSPPPVLPPASSTKKGRSQNKPIDTKPVLIDDLPLAWEDAHETFETLDKCVYERKDLGLSREADEMMICDCVFDKRDPDAQPCSDHSDCINRALFIECLGNECRAKSQCRNQRFTKQQYAPVEIVLTEMKGFGLRAADNIPSGSLIYEYIGEVVQEKTFRKRMQLYAEEGIRHFYFMMLQKEEYIDATKKGGIGRFANHSCNPNSEVQKWVVGRRLRMGIFTKRDVVRGEEITFNYNVDRYGHDAQICYCGEPNCVGFIGGKTQTDIGTMNDLFIDALGIADEVEELQLKGSKKKKSRQLDEDFVPILRPIEDHEVQKVAAAMRQSAENSKMMSRLLQRVNMSEDPSVHRQLMRMHGFGLMNMVLTQMGDERDLVLLALESMAKWKLQIRNKVEDSNIEEPVKALRKSEDEKIRTLAEQLIEHWSTLETSYKIPRKSKIASLDAEDEAATTTIAEADSIPYNPAHHRRPQAWENTASIQLDIAPVRFRPLPSFARPRPPPPPQRHSTSQSNSTSSDRSKLDAIIALAQQNVAVAPAIPAVSPAAESSRSGSRTVDDDEDRRKRQKREPIAADEGRKERRLTKLVGEHVVKSMSKYKDQMEHETFKRYAKECTLLLVEKEKKGSSYAATRHPTLSDEKKTKMKAFVKEYTHKVLAKLKAKGKLRKPSSSHAHTNLTSTPSSTATPMTVSTPSAILATPNGGGSLDTPNGEGDGQLMADIFGGDDNEMDLDDDDADHRDDLHTPSSPLGKSTDKSDEPLIGEKRRFSDYNSNGNANGTGQGNGNGNAGSAAAVKVDSFRPGVANLSAPISLGLLNASLSTPSRTPTSGGDGPSPESHRS